ncbi:MAG: hypothetical protein JWO56_3699 [Acidobacteria bacterium]|nr:hypothetical protein [Acidobacteriota bacterium]
MSITSPLIDARLQLHHAAQIAAGVGRTLVARCENDSHTAFSFADGTLLQEPVDGRRAGLRLRDLTLVCGSETFPLCGCTMDEGFAFLEARVGSPLKRPDVDLPDHPVAHGAPFDASPLSCATFDALYAEADSLLRPLGGSPVLCWPHHFDIATLLTVGEGTTIGVGLSPGDHSYPEPYWYVTPYPYPATTALPSLTRGRWHTAGWVGAVLAAEPRADAGAFLAEAIAHSRTLLAGLQFPEGRGG